MAAAFLEDGLNGLMINQEREKEEPCNEKYFVIRIKNSDDDASKKDVIQYFNPQVEKTFSTNPNHMSKEIKQIIKKLHIEDAAFLIIDTTSLKDAQKGECLKLMEFNAQIQDTAYKWFVTQDKKVYAKALHKSAMKNRDTYCITGFHKDGQYTFTFKNTDNDLYFAYDNGKFVLKETTTIDDDIYNFNVNPSVAMIYSISPVTSPDMFISTSQENNSPVTIEHKEKNDVIMEFIFRNKIFVNQFIPGCNTFKELLIIFKQ
ncbi:uncharacterized protein LOC128663454 [Bombina bombina]|uniref:uncharacterized protein LOC128663454 n=1 Tax=Bombina bombina TaxID=8345 RepID=UPI00235B2AE0|nr:uncharacterized protein LOC128663454 [Bombina bombina]